MEILAKKGAADTASLSTESTGCWQSHALRHSDLCSLRAYIVRPHIQKGFETTARSGRLRRIEQIHTFAGITLKVIEFPRSGNQVNR